MRTGNQREGPAGVTRRRFMATSGAVAAAVSIVPRHVLGGAGFVAPSEKITLAYIGCGTQGLREMLSMLEIPEVQIVAVCDPVKEGYEYVDWSRDGLRSSIARAIGKSDWRLNAPGIPGGRMVAKEVVELSYAKQRGQPEFKGCAVYADFRELLAREKDVNAIKVMTPDHLHATISIAGMKQGKHVLMHKPLANRLVEARLVIESARKTKVTTHFLPASDGATVRPVKQLIDRGSIGVLREIHNWSNRPMWPQYSSVPTETPPVPEGFDWQLWLGPSLVRPYHPHYTHAVFRGWYEFGGGALADMGHYSLWPVFQQWDLDAPIEVESCASHVCTLNGRVATRVKNDYSFPAACAIRFHFAAKGNRPALNLFWYDGSMKPATPEEFGSEEELPAEGMMWVGDKGKIVAGFRGENARLLSGATGRSEVPGQATEVRDRRSQAVEHWIRAIKSGRPTYGDFLLAGPISDAFNLGAVSLRLGGRRLRFDAGAGQVTNVPEANPWLGRAYRVGWELTAA